VMLVYACSPMITLVSQRPSMPKLLMRMRSANVALE
jgi:hypothetical protein